MTQEHAESFFKDYTKCKWPSLSDEEIDILWKYYDAVRATIGDETDIEKNTHPFID